MSRPTCVHCLLPHARCYCRWVKPINNHARVIIWQHPSEALHPKGTVALLQANLRHCQRLVTEQLEQADFLAQTQLSSITGLCLLYPSDSETPKHEQQKQLKQHERQMSQSHCLTDAEQTLLVLDGTWRKSRKLLHVNPWLLELPRLSLDASYPSGYHIRKAHKQGQLSTLEAVSYALSAISEADEGEYTQLLERFAGYQQQLQSAASR